jgi:acetylornithine/succinyldiaminopimelate/putrescine aminotransferase
VSNWFTNEPALRLAQKLSIATFAERVFFCNSGAEANEAALKLARRYAHDRVGPKKSRIVSTVERVPRPHAVHGHRRRPGEIRDRLRTESRRHHARPYNDVAALEPEFAAHGAEICAMILEPMQGEGA